MFEMQQELLNKTRACNKAQILHTVLSAKLVEHLLINDIAGYLLNGDKLQKFFEALIWTSTDDEETPLQVIKELQSLIQNRLNEFKPLVDKLKQYTQECCGSDKLHIESSLYIDTTNPTLRIVREFEDYDTSVNLPNIAFKLNNIRTNYDYNPLVSFASVLMLLIYPFSSKAVKNIQLSDNYYKYQLPYSKVYKLQISYQIRKVEQLRPLHIAIIATIACAMLYVITISNKNIRSYENWRNDKIYVQVFYRLKIISGCDKNYSN